MGPSGEISLQGWRAGGVWRRRDLIQADAFVMIDRDAFQPVHARIDFFVH